MWLCYPCNPRTVKFVKLAIDKFSDLICSSFIFQNIFCSLLRQVQHIRIKLASMSHHKSYSTNLSAESATALSASAGEIQPDSLTLSNVEVLGGSGESRYNARKQRRSSQKQIDRSRPTIFKPVRSAPASRVDGRGSHSKRKYLSKSRNAVITRGESTGSSTDSSSESATEELSDSSSAPSDAALSDTDAEEPPNNSLSDELSESGSEETVNSSSDSNPEVSSQEDDSEDEGSSIHDRTASNAVQRKKETQTEAIYLRIPLATNKDVQWKILRKLRSQYPGALVVLDDSPAKSTFSQRTSLALLWQWIQDGRIDCLFIARLNHICKSTEALQLFEWMCEGYGVRMRVQPSLDLALNAARKK